MSNPYEILAAFARWEQEAIAEGRVDSLAERASEWEGLLSSLPAEPPESARAALEAAQRALVSGIAQLEAHLDEVRRELGATGRSRAVVASYGPATTAGGLDARG